MIKLGDDSYFFGLTGSFFVENDNGQELDPDAPTLQRGTYERQLITQDRAFRQLFVSLFDNYIQNVLAGRSVLDSQIGNIEQSNGLLNPLYADLEIRKKISIYLLRIGTEKGNRRTLCFMLQQLGFTDCTITETFYNGGFDAIQFDAPSFDGVTAGVYSEFDVQLFSNPAIVITPQIQKQILDIIAFNTAVFTRLNRVFHNGVLIYNAQGDVQSSFFTVKNGLQTIVIVSNESQTIQINYVDTATSETQTNTTFTFSNTYPDSTEKQFDIIFANESVITQLDFSDSELSQIPNLTKYVALSLFVATINANATPIILDILPIFDLRLVILSISNTIDVTNNTQLESVDIIANDAIVNIDSCSNLTSLKLQGTGATPILSDSGNNLAIELIDYTIADFSTINTISKAATVAITLSNVTLSTASYDFSVFANIENISVIYSDVGAKTFNFGLANNVVVRNELANIDITVDANVLETLNFSQETTSTIFDATFLQLTSITYSKHRNVSVDGVPNLTSIVCQNNDIGILGSSFSIANLQNLTTLNCSGNLFGTFNAGNVLGAIIPALSAFKNLVTIDFRRCNYNQSEIDQIITDILNAESTPGQQFLNASKTLDLSNDTTSINGDLNAVPSAATITKIEQLKNFYGWTIKTITL